jgi:DNA-binding NtrC family response regulator
VHKILIVDDDSDILLELEELLMGLGFTCVYATCASAALAHLESHSDIELLISDLRLPDRSGLRLLQVLREREDVYADLPIIITSGHADMDDVITLFRTGAVDFLPKPIHYEHLVAILQKLFPERELS